MSQLPWQGDVQVYVGGLETAYKKTADHLTAFADAIEKAVEGHTPRSDWTEIPLATFLAWTEREQLVYCAARDEDSATHEDDEERRAWYLQRAARYRARTEAACQ